MTSKTPRHLRDGSPSPSLHKRGHLLTGIERSVSHSTTLAREGSNVTGDVGRSCQDVR